MYVSHNLQLRLSCHNCIIEWHAPARPALTLAFLAPLSSGCGLYTYISVRLKPLYFCTSHTRTWLCLLVLQQVSSNFWPESRSISKTRRGWRLKQKQPWLWKHPCQSQSMRWQWWHLGGGTHDSTGPPSPPSCSGRHQDTRTICSVTATRCQQSKPAFSAHNLSSIILQIIWVIQFTAWAQIDCWCLDDINWLTMTLGDVRLKTKTFNRCVWEDFV